MMRVLDLFSGIGGFSLGLEMASPEFQTVAFCEQDEFCQKVLRKHWPDVPIYDDVRTLDATGLGRIDLICGGYPCQPFSLAGKRDGAEDDRHLWPSMLALVQELRPDWVIGENVFGHVSMGLDEVLSDLEGEGYTARAFVIPACAVDAPHRRDRVWIVANTRYKFSNVSGKHSLEEGSKERKGRTEKQDGHISSLVQDISGRISRDWWGAQSRMDRTCHGVPRRVDRLKALGNAVVPQVVQRIGEAIIQAEAVHDR